MIRYILLTTMAVALAVLMACEDDCEFRAVTTSALSDGIVGNEYDFQITTSQTCTPRFRDFQIAGGVLPPGLVLGTAGRVRGTPTLAGEYIFTIRAEYCFSERDDPDTNQPVYSNCKVRTQSLTMTVFEN